MTSHATAARAATPPRTPVPTGRAPRERHRARRVVTALAALAAACALAAGCGVRLETPPPTEPSPDTVEVLRRGAVDDALTVADLVADVTPSVTDPTALAVLDEAADFAGRHVEQLGGVYDSGLDALAGTDGATPDVAVTTGGGDDAATTGAPADDSTDPTTGEATTDDVVVALVGAAQRTGASADASPDAELARLLASVAASEHLTAQRLAAATGSTAADALVSTAPSVQDAPAGVGAGDLATLVEAEDAAGYAYEVSAARSEGDERTAALARAAEHRARAQAWALAAGTDGTAQDPRRAAYALPDDADAPTLARRVESGLGQTYATLVAAAAPSSRTEAVALLVDSWADAVAWGEPPTAFPGLPEQAAG